MVDSNICGGGTGSGGATVDSTGDGSISTASTGTLTSTVSLSSALSAKGSTTLGGGEKGTLIACCLFLGCLFARGLSSPLPSRLLLFLVFLLREIRFIMFSE